MNLREYIKQEYEKCKEEYSQNKIKLEEEYNYIISKIEEKSNEYNIKKYELPMCGKKLETIYIKEGRTKKDFYCTTYYDAIFPEKVKDQIWISKYDEILNKQECLKTILYRTKEVLDNKEQYISIKKEELNSFAKYKNIEILDKIGEYCDNSNIKGNIEGYLSGSKALGFGSIGGNIEGKLNGQSNANYEDSILIKYTYDLDYELEDYILDDLTLEKVLKNFKELKEGNKC